MYRDIELIVSKTSEIPWKKDEYKKQNWGIWLHSVSSYVGRIKPAFAHWLVRICSEQNDVILDPFCGVGTVVLEADLLGREAIGNDLNPYAYIISKSKFDRNSLKDEEDYLKKIKLNTKKVDLSVVPPWVKEYYHQQTLREILNLRDHLIRDNRFFLLGCLLGIAHGHRKQHLSIRTGYIIPYIPKPKPPVEYREVLPRMIQKVRRMYKDHFPIKSRATILNEDTKKLSLADKSVDVIISSPPYYHTLDYVESNRLRLWFAGIDFDKQKDMKNQLIQQEQTYLSEMAEVGEKLHRTLKNDGLIVFVLGDVHVGRKTINTAKNISELYSNIGFITHAIIDDEIPASRTTIVKYGGEKAIINKKQKLDRVLFMTKQ